MKRTFTRLLGLAVLLFASQVMWAQKQTPLDIALRYAEQHTTQWGLQAADITDMVVSSQYQSRHNGVTHHYFVQRYMGIEVHNAVMGIHVGQSGQVGFATQRFVANLASKVNATTPQISAYQAIALAARHVGLPMTENLRLVSKVSDQEYIYDGGSVSESDIKVKLMFKPNEKTGEVRLAWSLAIEATDSPDYWSMRVDALNGAILDRGNWTLYCSFSDDACHVHDDACVAEAQKSENLFSPVKEVLTARNLSNTNLADGTYNVFPIPVESPIHGERQLLVAPHDLMASPYGWHDTNGQDGPEYTITRGNNVFAYLDADATANSPDGVEPDGGASLLFDFPFDQSQEPNAYLDAAQVQLFYMNNIMHDFTFAYGFDEAGGNFQDENYSNDGEQNDQVFAEAQDASGTNNANFSTPPDGSSGRMQMFLWDRSGGRLLNVIEPQAIAGGYTTSTAGFGPAISTTPITGEAVNAYDGTGSPFLCCNPIVNTDEVNGKIALITRGSCFFEEKVVNAEAAGAIAVVVCNFEESTVAMGGRPDIPDPTIPAVMIKNSDCNLIRAALDEGVVITLVLPDDSGPAQLDGDFDNGIIAHEYGHGISNRLTGGPLITDCLFNDEQMGEGWSDFFSLITTVEPGDAGTQSRGIGNYAINAGATGGGIRRLPYSTDFSINNQDYDDVVGTAAPHPLGEVWTGVLWDLYWAMVDEYGFDPDQYHGTGGNNRAIQLVIDGMKLQACNPGFIDGRDAIIAADYFNYEGVDECLIWNVFARRGLGYNADQGSSQNRNDGRIGFEPLPECIKELKISKSVTPLIEAGDEITVTITVTNHKTEAVTDVVVKDELPTGLTYIAGSTSNGVSVTPGAGDLTFDIGNMDSGESLTFLYKAASDPNKVSIRQFFDDMENGEDYWAYDVVDQGTDIWQLINTTNAYDGDYAWYVPSTPTENDQILYPFDPIEISGTQPVIRFYHSYDTQAGIDGGIIQISTDGSFWQSAEPYIFRGDYRGAINYNTFAIPNQRAYWGNSNGYISTYLDLTPFAGQQLYFRFRWGTDEETDGATDGSGWYMDNFEVMDMRNYNGEICITTAEGDQICLKAPGYGTVIESAVVTGTDEPALNHQVMVYPNPAGSLLNVAFRGEIAGPVTVEIINTDGRQVLRHSTQLDAGYQVVPINTSQLAAGMYFVKINTDYGFAIEKVVIED